MNAIRTAVAVALLAASAGVASAATINVPGDSPTIQGGIDLAFDGDTVVIAAGTYSATLFLDQRNNLTIRANGIVTITANRGAKGVAGINFSSCTNVTFDGFAFSKPLGNGISVSTCLGMSIRNCTVDRPKGFGILVYGGQDVTIADCTVTGTSKKYAGIGAFPGFPTKRMHVQRCAVTKTGGPGIFVNGVAPLVEDCTVTSAKKSGIEMDRAGGTGDAIIRRCIVTASGDTGIVVAGGSDLVEDNQVSSSLNYGIAVLADTTASTTAAVVQRNTITKTKKKDAILSAAPQSTIGTNTISATRGDAIRVNETGSFVIDNQITTTRGAGVHLTGSGHTVTGNTATDSKKADLLDQSTGSTIGTNLFVKIKP